MVFDTGYSRVVVVVADQRLFGRGSKKGDYTSHNIWYSQKHGIAGLFFFNIYTSGFQSLSASRAATTATFLIVPIQATSCQREELLVNRRIDDAIRIVLKGSRQGRAAA